MRELPRDLNQSDIIYSGPKMNFPLHVSDTVKSENFSKFFLRVFVQSVILYDDIDLRRNTALA